MCDGVKNGGVEVTWESNGIKDKNRKYGIQWSHTDIWLLTDILVDTCDEMPKMTKYVAMTCVHA